MKGQHKVKSIFRRVFLPLLAVVALQTILFVGMFNSTGVIRRVQENAIESLTEKTESRKTYLYNEMAGRWANLTEEEREISGLVFDYLQNAGYNPQEMQTSWQLKTRILEMLAPRLIEILRQKQTTGVFCILDGTGAEDGGQSRAAFYVRDTDPTAVAANNSDLMVVRGAPQLARALKLSLSSGWQASFDAGEESADSAAFFWRPLQAAVRDHAQSGRYYSYWSGRFRLNDDPAEEEIVTCTLPLIGADGTVYGVFGIELAADYLARELVYDEIAADRQGVYLLGVTKDGGSTYETVCLNGTAAGRYLGDGETLTLAETEYGALREVSRPASGLNERELFACVQPLELYARNAPFEQEQWALISIVPQDILLGFANQFQRILLICIAASICTGIVAALLASRSISRPIRNLADELRGSDPDREIRLTRIDIREIDELSASIEALSIEVAESSSRFSQIVSMAGIPLGVFEYNRETDSAFCSESLFQVMGWPGFDSEKTSYTGEELAALFGNFGAQLYDKEADVYQITRAGEAHPVWLQLSVQNENEMVLGAVLDVTKDVAQKRKVEYERDYDTLTNTLNRRGFERMLEKQFGQHKEALGVAALVMLDLDNLKYVNDTYGHDSGDKYIKTFAEQLRGLERYGAIVSRRSGDEFNVLLYGFQSKEKIRAVLRELWQSIAAARLVLPDGDSCKIRASAGLAWYPEDSQSYAELLKYADFAMYTIKHSVKGEIAEFDRAAYNTDAILVNGAEALTRMIEGGLVRYAMQPIVDMNGEIYGYDMLMRPQVPEFTTPYDVLRIARAQSKLQHIERLTWEKSLDSFARLRQAGQVPENARVFVSSVSSQPLPAAVREKLEQTYGDLLDHVVIELTEGGAHENTGLHTKIDMIRSWGGMIAIDDFGPGHNTELSLLSASPNILKLDISLVKEADKDTDRRNLIGGIVTYARSRGILVLADGVETREEMCSLAGLGVDLMQGFYIARPSFEPEPIDGDIVESIRSAAGEHADG